nr:BrnT family toxin [Massilia sp. YIM B02769]
MFFVSTIICVEIAFDTTKDAVNLGKHGVSLAAAAMIEWEDALTWTDDRHHYGEARMCAIAYIGDRLHYVVYVDRAEARRIISLHKANLREVKRYAEA